MSDTITQRSCPEHPDTNMVLLEGAWQCSVCGGKPIERTFVAVDALERYFVDSPLTLREVRGAIEAVKA